MDCGTIPFVIVAFSLSCWKVNGQAISNFKYDTKTKETSKFAQSSESMTSVNIFMSRWFWFFDEKAWNKPSAVPWTKKDSFTGDGQ